MKAHGEEQVRLQLSEVAPNHSDMRGKVVHFALAEGSPFVFEERTLSPPVQACRLGAWCAVLKGPFAVRRRTLKQDCIHQDARDNKLTAEIGERHLSLLLLLRLRTEARWDSSLYRSHYPDKAGASTL